MATPHGRVVRSKRNIQHILILASHGCTLRTIAEATGLNTKTVRDKVRKLGVRCAGYEPVVAPRVWDPLPGGRPHCLGHRFGAQLVCVCGVTWAQHQVARQPCGADMDDYCAAGHLKSVEWYTPPIGSKSTACCNACRRDLSARRRGEG